jgi:uncharacterized protein (TIGR02099 family)
MPLLPSRLQPVLAGFDRPWLRRILRIVGLGLVVGYFGFALLVLALRYAILPEIERYRPEIEQAVGSALERPVSVGRIEAYWVGLHPALRLKDIDVRDAEGRSALKLAHVETELAWDSLLTLQIRLARLEIIGPDLVLRRDATGRFFVAGMEIDTTPSDEPGFADWVMDQSRIVIRDASLRWIDEQRGAPPLELHKLNLILDNRFTRHRFGFTAEPPAALATRIDIRGDFKGRDIDELEAWKGELYADLGDADLAVWQQWIDYPLSLPQGRGGLRLWLGFARQQLTSLTADLRLADVRAQLRPDLPELDLVRLDGRLSGQRTAGGFDARVEHLDLLTRDGVSLPTVDLKLGWRESDGTFNASGLDLGALSRLASSLPLEPAFRERLAAHQPGGRIQDLSLAWRGAATAPSSWTIKGRFTGLGLTALGPIPGIAGFNGRIEGDQTGGRLTLDGQQASINLPEIFPEPTVVLDRFAAEIGWRPGDKGLEVNLQKVSFENADAAGEASGRWRPSAAYPDGPGVIDLDARLSRADALSVWRYLPKVIGVTTRSWLRGSLIGGSSRDVSLRLKGDLFEFPFVQNRGGQFLVKGAIQGARLDYADGWPPITDIDGDYLFEGSRMLITARQGKILGATVRDTKAEIADLLSHEELLSVTGKAGGPTSEFLRFIEASPVGDRIDHFTSEMDAEGNGDLDLKLSLPLQRMQQAKIDGTYRFDNNQLKVDADLPPLTEVRGQLRFTGDLLESKGLRASLLGSPTQIDIRTGNDHNVQVNANGDFSIAALRKQFGSPLLDHFSGASKWNGTVRIRKKAAEVAVSSNLVGVSSSLPPPFNKSAIDILPLRFERKPPPAPPVTARKVGAGGTASAPTAPPTDLIDFSLGKVLRLQLVRRHDTTPATITRGALALGPAALAAFPAVLPERALTIQGALPLLDADFWRATLADSGNGGAPQLTLPPMQFDLRTDELHLFNKSFRDIRLTGNRSEPVTRFELKSPDLAGSFTWDATGAGKLSGKIGQLAIPANVTQADALQSEVGDIVESLPALDLNIGHLSFKGRELGGLNLAAENRDGFWNARLDLRNDDMQLKGTAKWRPQAKQQETRLDFDLNTKSIEKLLERLGHNEGMRRGTAHLTGQLSWRGPPFTIDYPSLTGALESEAANGQFTKLEPGVGRLLGVLSLQSLPRRITLDFRDVFSEGFAFDRIRGKFSVNQGIMQTKDFQIQGPAANVMMDGSIDLGRETQNLQVRVQPALGETLATGVLLANPATGAVAWAMNKLLNNPFDKVFAFEYLVTGTWTDPKVDKQGAAAKPEEKK